MALRPLARCPRLGFPSRHSVTQLVSICCPNRTRTCDLPLRKGTLYSTELQDNEGKVTLGSTHVPLARSFVGYTSHLTDANHRGIEPLTFGSTIRCSAIELMVQAREGLRDARGKLPPFRNSATCHSAMALPLPEEHPLVDGTTSDRTSDPIRTGDICLEGRGVTTTPLTHIFLHSFASSRLYTVHIGNHVVHTWP